MKTCRTRRLLFGFVSGVMLIVTLAAPAHAAYRSYNLCGADIRNSTYTSGGTQYGMAVTEESSGCYIVGARVQTYYVGYPAWSSWDYDYSYALATRVGTLTGSQHYLEGTGALYPSYTIYSCGSAGCGTVS
jgi:hypothetical protein